MPVKKYRRLIQWQPNRRDPFKNSQVHIATGMDGIAHFKKGSRNAA